MQIKSNFNAKTFAQDVIIRLPCPSNTAKTNFKVFDGKTKYDPKKQCIEWKIKRFPGGNASYRLKGEVQRSIGNFFSQVFDKKSTSRLSINCSTTVLWKVEHTSGFVENNCRMFV